MYMYVYDPSAIYTLPSKSDCGANCAFLATNHIISIAVE